MTTVILNSTQQLELITDTNCTYALWYGIILLLKFYKIPPTWNVSSPLRQCNTLSMCELRGCLSDLN